MGTPAAKAKAAKAPAVRAERRPAPHAPAGGTLIALRHPEIAPDPNNPRKAFAADAVAELADTIARDGLLEPLVVRPKDGAHLLIAGERRWRAIGLLIADGRWTKTQPIPCMLREVDDVTARALALVENLQRVDLNPMEEAEALKALRDTDPKTYTIPKLAAMIGKTERHVELRLVLVNKLAAAAQKALRADKIKLAHAREIAQLPGTLQARFTDKLAKDSGVTSTELQQWIDEEEMPVSAAAFDLEPYAHHVAERKRGKKTEHVFLDKELFLKLQTEAAKAKVKELKKDWAWAKFEAGYFNSYEYVAGVKDKTKAGCVVTIDRWRGEIRVHTGLAPRRDAAAGAAKKPSKDERAKKKAQEQALKRAEEAAEPFGELLATGVARDPAAALRMLAFVLMEGFSSQSMFRLGWNKPGRAVVDVEDAAKDETVFGKPWADSFQPWLAGRKTVSESAEDRGRLWDAITEVSERDMPKFLAAVAAQTLRLQRVGGSMKPKLDPAVTGLAGLLGLPVPEPLLAFAVTPKGKATAAPSAAAAARPKKGRKAAPFEPWKLPPGHFERQADEAERRSDAAADTAGGESLSEALADLRQIVENDPERDALDEMLAGWAEPEPPVPTVAEAEALGIREDLRRPDLRTGNEILDDNPMPPFLRRAKAEG